MLSAGDNRSDAINVCHLVHEFKMGGAEAIVDTLCRASSPNITNSIGSFVTPSPGGPFQKTANSAMFTLDKRTGNDIRIVARLARELDKRHINVIHSQAWGTYLEGLLASKIFYHRRCKYIFAFHGKTIGDIKQGIPFGRRFAQHLAHYFVDAIIAPSRNMAEDYARTYAIPPEKIRVIYNGIDVVRYSGKQCGKHEIDSNDSTSFVVGFVGRLDPVKNLDGLLTIFTLFRAKLQAADKHKVRLMIVGDGPELQHLQILSSDLGISKNVCFVGRSDDVPACLAQMDVYVQPSFYEGFSLTILEAMASGIPVISTDVGGTCEIIENRIDGFLFDPANHEKMASSVLSLYNNMSLRNRIGCEARKKIRDRFAIRGMITEYEKLYRELLA